MGHSHFTSTTSTREILDKLWDFLRPDRKDLTTIIGFALAIGIFSIALPMGVQIFVGNLAVGTALQPLFIIALLVMLGSGVSGFMRGLQLWTAELLQRKLFLRISLDLAYRLPRIEASELRSMVGADLVYRYLCLTTVQKGGVYLILEGIDILLKTFIGALILAFYHPILLVFDFLLISSIVYIFWGLAQGAGYASVKEGKAKFKLASWLEEVSRHHLMFRTESGRRFAFERADDFTSDYLEARKQSFSFVFKQASGIFLLQAIVGAALLAIGGILIIKQQLTIGQLVAAELIVTGIVSTLSKFPKHLETFYDLCAALDKLGSLFDQPLEAEGGESLAQTGPASLKISNLKFVFDSNKTLLNDFSLDLPQGGRIAILAPHGSGKTILANLIYGLDKPTAGSIEIDGLDLRSLRRGSIRENIAVVRGTQLIQGTILENIRFARPEISMEAAMKAAERLGLRDSILALPQGYETEISFNGQPLSSNQALLISLARVIAGTPRLIILDGTLDALPEEIRELVLLTLLKPNVGWTTLLLTLDASIARRMTQTFELIHGRLNPLGPGTRKVKAVSEEVKS